MTQVAVVGAGIAGCTAALAASRAGASVTVIGRAPGATALYAGAMEISGDLATLSDREPHHPFVRLGIESAGLGAMLDEACEVLREALGAGGLPLSGDWRVEGRYVDLHGSVRPAHLAPVTVAGGELGGLQGKEVTVVGVREVGEYEPEVVAAALTAEAGARARSVEVEMDLPVGASLTDLFERPAPRLDGGRGLVAYPPGLRELPERGFELLAAPPSPHGWRLQQAMERALRQSGIRLISREVTSARTEGSVLIEVGDVAAEQFVLATGRYIGGGLVKSTTIREPLLDLGVFHDGRAVDGDYAAQLRHMEYLSPESAFRAGLMTDARLRPFDRTGAVPIHNLRAAGSVLGGYDYGRGYGFGVPILTGWLAGRWAAS